MSLIARVSLLSRSAFNFPVMERMLLAKEVLRTLQRTIFIVKSNSTLSILGKALNHTPERMAFSFNFVICVLSRKLKVLFCGTIIDKIV